MNRQSGHAGMLAAPCSAIYILVDGAITLALTRSIDGTT